MTRNIPVVAAGLVVTLALTMILTGCNAPKRKSVDVKTTVKVTVGKRF